jgi:mannose/fructose/N-acetylgalactosamine-specific phosphotransferase system component IIC
MSWFVTLGVIAGVLAVDQRAGWQSLLAQPVFAAVLVGSILGEPWVALAVGVVLELIYLSIVPMRGAKTPDHIAAGVVGGGTASLLLRHTGESRIAFVCAVGLFLGLVAGELGARLALPMFGLQNRFLSSVEFSPDTGRRRLARRVFLLHVSSVGFIFMVESLLVLALCAGGYYVGERFTRLVDGTLVQGAMWWGSLGTAIGVASIIHLFWQHRLRRVLIVCALLVVIVLWLM